MHILWVILLVRIFVYVIQNTVVIFEQNYATRTKKELPQITTL